MIDLSFPVDFLEALEWAEDRGIVLPRTYYEDLPAEMRSLAFTVSYLTQIGQIETILNSLTDAVAAGLSFLEWQSDPIVISAVSTLTPLHSETIYRNFMQTAFQAGHWQQQEEGAGSRPYLMYSAIIDGRETDLCHGLDGLIRPVTDPIWRSYYPPNHHNCRSSVISLTESQAQMRSPKGEGLYADMPTDEFGNPLRPDDGWDHNPLDAKIALDQLLADRKQSLASISPDLAQFFEEASRAVFYSAIR